MPSLRSQDRQTRSSGRPSTSSSSRRAAPSRVPTRSTRGKIAISDDDDEDDDDEAAQEAARSGSVSIRRSKRPPPSAVRAAGGKIKVSRPTRISRSASAAKPVARSTRGKARQASSEEDDDDDDDDDGSDASSSDERPRKRRAATRKASTAYVSLPSPPPKRRPGRPRKQPSPPIKRPRGRPPKQQPASRPTRPSRLAISDDDDFKSSDGAEWMDVDEDDEEVDQLADTEDEDDMAFGTRRRPRRSPPKRRPGRPSRASQARIKPSRRSGRASRVSYAEPTGSDVDQLESDSDGSSAPRRPRSKRLAKKLLTRRRSALISSSDEEEDKDTAVRIQPHITVEAPEVDDDLAALFPMQENVLPDPSGALPFRTTTRGNRRGRKARFAEPIVSDDEIVTSDEEAKEIVVLSDSSEEEEIEIGVAAEDKARRKRKRTVLMARRKPGAPDSDEEELALAVGEDTLGDDAADEHDSRPLAAHDKHWEFCQRCMQKPADVMLRKLYKTRDKLKAMGKLPDEDKPDVIQPVRGQRSARTALGAGVYDERVEASAGTRLLERIEEVEQLGGWVECASCTLSIHWDCQGSKRRRDALDEVNAVEEARWKATADDDDDVFIPYASLEPGERLSFVECVNCYSASGWKCMLCQRDEWRHEQQGLLFRCKRCMRCSHYGCLQEISGDDDVEGAAEGRQRSGWLCFDCEGWGEIDEILAWRPSAEAAKRPEPKIPPGKRMPVYTPKHNLPREYLVKFRDASFREVQWVPHHWLALVDFNALRTFLAEGCRVELEPRKDDLGQRQRGQAKLGAAAAASHSQSRAVELLASSQPALAGTRRSARNTLALAEAETGTVESGPPVADPDAASRIPTPWKTPDRILDVFFKLDVLDDDDAIEARRNAAANHRRGPAPLVPEEPKERFRKDPRLVHISEVVDSIDLDDADATMPLIARVLVKWQDVGYEQTTWESTPDPTDHADIWSDYLAAYARFLSSKRVYIPHRTRLEMDTLDSRDGITFKPYKKQPPYVVAGELLDFQLEGLNWLRYGWYRHQPGILADEMGLGKTIQVISFIACLHHDHNASPALVVVPNSTMANWLREFEKWTPSLRVVPYYGEASNRAVVETYELFHDDDVQGREALKTHVVLCSDSAARNIPWVLRRVQRWEVLVVDEGQNLKSGQTNKLHRNLAELPVAHRLIMTGTPLNNNIGELFNLLNWLHPGDQWDDLPALKRKYAFLTPELIEELQPKLRPYFLRRLKVNVVKDLPPKTELIVPIPMRPIQKRLYKSILESNVEDIAALANGVSMAGAGGKRHVISKMNSILWLLRKCVQHPYLVSPYLEGDDRPPESGEAESKEDLQRLIDASSKLLFLKKLLPKLKAGGHRVLLFSQMVINLDIVEAFVAEMGYKSLRLDGSIGAKQRQRGIDAFNAPDSDVFIYLLSTRAGGIGINLATADTVIIYDPDFNPHQDNQAIARAHRIGQKKHVMVFSLVGKNTAEEQIVENARRKKVLDHVIVQNLQNEDSGPAALEAVLKHGAQALFAEDTSPENDRDTVFTDDEIEQLIRRARVVEEVTRDDQADVAGQFSFAQVWEHDEAAPDTAMAENDIGSSDFWTQLLDKSREAEQERLEKEMRADAVGRGKRKRVKTTFYVQAEHAGPTRRRRKSSAAKESDDEQEQRFTFDLQPIDITNEASEDSDLDADIVHDISSEEDDLLEEEVVDEDDLLGIGGTPLKASQPLRRRDWRIGIKGPGRPTAAEAEARAIAKAAQPKRPRGRPPNPNKQPRAPRVAKPKVPKELRISAATARRILEATAQQHVVEIQSRQQNNVAVEPIKEPKERPQLTQVHIAYFAKQLGFPPALFDWAFARVDSSQLPPSVQRLADEGAEFLDGAVVRRHLLNALHAMYAVWLENAARERQREAEKSRRKEIGRLTSEQANQLISAIDMLGADNLRKAARIAVEERDANDQEGMVGVLLARAKEIQERYPADARLSLAVSSIDAVRTAQASVLRAIRTAEPQSQARKRKRPEQAQDANGLPAGTTLADHYADDGYDAFGDSGGGFNEDVQAQAGPSSASMGPPALPQPPRPRPRPRASKAPPLIGPDGQPIKRKPGRPRKSDYIVGTAATTTTAPVAAPTAPAPKPAPPPPPPPVQTAKELASSKRCPICTGSFHFLTKCPLVANLPQATKRYREMLAELNTNPTSEGRRMVTFLRSHLVKKGVDKALLPEQTV